ncbi:MAG TPA: transposase [Pyrinomonadaceae bacterium]|nr:transposase [Pyrinomonadaceae bacterium]
MNSDWNDTGIPLAYLITFRCYGTWLHGDERGSTDEFNNVFDTPFLPSNPKWLEFNRSLLKNKPVELNAQRRNSVEKAIRETCQKRNWGLLAVNIRTNHVHVVVNTGNRNPNQSLIAFKANATRQMREDKIWNFENTPWAEKGSKKWLWNEKSVEIAIDYVINGQGEELPKFD